MEDSRASGDRPLERELDNRAGDEADARNGPPEDRPESSRSIAAVLGDRPAARVAAVIPVLLAVASLLWIGGELHYQSCLQEADVSTPGRDPLSRLVRQRDVERCSRLPF